MNPSALLIYSLTMRPDKKDIGKILTGLLTDKAGIDHAKTPVRVRAENGTITLEGVVDGISQKKRALFLAMGLPGVEGVADRLTVRPSKQMSDAEITEHIAASLSAEQTLSLTGIAVEVRGGAVDLEGAVGSLTHKRLAGVLAWWVPGVCDVINSLEVSPPEEDSDSEIDEALRIILEKDGLVDAVGINSKTQNSVVTLTGAARSETEKTAAEQDAWYVWGVNDVRNLIAVRRRDKTNP